MFLARFLLKLDIRIVCIVVERTIRLVIPDVARVNLIGLKVYRLVRYSDNPI